MSDFRNPIEDDYLQLSQSEIIKKLKLNLDNITSDNSKKKIGSSNFLGPNNKKALFAFFDSLGPRLIEVRLFQVAVVLDVITSDILIAAYEYFSHYDMPLELCEIHRPDHQVYKKEKAYKLVSSLMKPSEIVKELKISYATLYKIKKKIAYQKALHSSCDKPRSYFLTTS